MKVFEYTIANFTSTFVCESEADFIHHMIHDCGEDINNVSYIVTEEFDFNPNSFTFTCEKDKETA